MTSDIASILQEQGYTDLVLFPSGQWFGLLPFVFTSGLMVGVTPCGYARRYCYEFEADARVALRAWNGRGHPSGPWIKCKGKGIDLLNPAWTVNF